MHSEIIAAISHSESQRTGSDTVTTELFIDHISDIYTAVDSIKIIEIHHSEAFACSDILYDKQEHFRRENVGIIIPDILIKKRP